MTLSELIAALEAEDPALVLPDGFAHPHSYRGYYDQLAFEPARNVTVGAMLTTARSALGATYGGWKGGEYTMHKYTECWLAAEGCEGEGIGPVLIRLMVAAGKAPDAVPGAALLEIDPAKLGWLADWLDEDDKTKTWLYEQRPDVFPSTWRDRGTDVQADLRRWAALLRNARPGSADLERYADVLHRIAGGTIPAEGAAQAAYDALDGCAPGPETLASLEQHLGYARRAVAEYEQLARDSLIPDGVTRARIRERACLADAPATAPESAPERPETAGAQRETPDPSEALPEAADGRIVCLCGSTKFRDEFTAANRRLTLAGNIVLAPGVFGHSGDLSAEDAIGGDGKAGLDELHRRKIDMADECLIVSRDGYFGTSTAGEISYAVAHGKPVRFAENTARQRAAGLGLITAEPAGSGS